MAMGSFEGGCGFTIFILVLFRALKYMDGCLFLFGLGLTEVLSATRTVVASLYSVLGDTSAFFASVSFSFVFSASASFVSSIPVLISSSSC